MTKPILSAAWLLLALPAAVQAQVTEADLRRHIEILASDAYEGRRPGTAGGERTEAYILEAFAKAGLQPGTADGRWRQGVLFGDRKPIAGTLSIGGKAYSSASEEIALAGWQPNARIAAAPMLFAGYATVEELRNARLDGAVLIRLSGKAPSGRTRLSIPALMENGAVAVITITPETGTWAQHRSGWEAGLRSDRVSQGPGIEGVVSSGTAAALLKGAGADLAELRARVAGADFTAVPLKPRADLNVETKVRTFETANIVGKIPGTKRPEEGVVLLAHWDHMGICRPEGAPDRICNGANDNASGTATIIEAARHLAAGPKPERSIYLVATTAEEIGLVGADAFAAAPPAKIVAAFNMDTTAIAPKGKPVAIIGRGTHPKMDAIVDSTAQALGRGVDTDTEANVMIERQDGWAFAKRGIPTLVAMGSLSDMNFVKSYLSGVYHKPDDDLANLKDLGGAVEDANLNIALIRAFASVSRYPTP